jgi:hypothetical protein
MAAMFLIGLSLGTWMGNSGDTTAVAAGDNRPRAVSGETRLLMDQSFEQFGRRAGTPGRASASPPEPATRPESGSEPKRGQQARVKSS